MEKNLMNTYGNTAEQSVTMPKNGKLSASDFGKIVKPTANYFGAGLNSLTSYLDD